MENKFNEVFNINVNDKAEQKNNLTYLSWAWAWGEFKKIYPLATYEIVKNADNIPYFADDSGAMVYTKVTANELTYEMWLPVMDSHNKSMKKESYTYKTKYGDKTVEAYTMFDVNKTIMRCLTKNLAMFGLGLYIYAGEDLPEDEEAKEKTKKEVVRPVAKDGILPAVKYDKSTHDYKEDNTAKNYHARIERLLGSTGVDRAKYFDWVESKFGTKDLYLLDVLQLDVCQKALEKKKQANLLSKTHYKKGKYIMEKELEFKLVRLESGVAVFNFEELKTELVAKLKGYKGYLVSAETIALAKNDRAELNKLAKAIDDKRKEVKKEIMKIYDTVFEPQCKELTALIKSASDEIDAKVKALEELEREKKREEIKELWASYQFDLVDLERVFSNSWLTKAYSNKKVTEDMQEIINKIKTNLMLLDNTDKPDELKAKYLSNLDMTTTMAQYNAEKEAATRLKESQERAKEVEVAKPIEVEKVVEVAQAPRLTIKKVTLEIKSSEQGLKRLGEWLRSNNYIYEQLTDIEDEA